MPPAAKRQSKRQTDFCFLQRTGLGESAHMTLTEREKTGKIKHRIDCFPPERNPFLLGVEYLSANMHVSQ